MDPVKEAFFKIKQDINDLKEAILALKQEVDSLKLDKNNQTIPTHNQSYLDTNSGIPTHNPTHDLPFKPLKQQNIGISTGNRGVPTDKQTNQQTDNLLEKEENMYRFNEFEQAKEVLDTLDNIKKEIRLKFKRLTPQEMLVFSTLYSLEEDFETNEITYKQIAQRLKLSESSIRDYINRLIIKGIPVIKTRQNNKTITLSISQDLKQIANLSTINKLKDL